MYYFTSVSLASSILSRFVSVPTYYESISRVIDAERVQ